MLIPSQHTGNKKLDSLIEKAIKKDVRWRNSNTPLEALDLIEETKNKYGVAPEDERILHGILFASKHEMERYQELVLLQKAGEITELQLQVQFELLEVFMSRQHGKINPIRYIADFVYKNKDGRTVVEDAKGMKTRDYELKRKLFLYKYGDQYLFYEV